MEIFSVYFTFFFFKKLSNVRFCQLADNYFVKYAKLGFASVVQLFFVSVLMYNSRHLRCKNNFFTLVFGFMLVVYPNQIFSLNSVFFGINSIFHFCC